MLNTRARRRRRRVVAMKTCNRADEQVLDNCIDEMIEGKGLEAVLATHGEHADALRPMLNVAALVLTAAPPPVRKSEHKVSFLEAVEARRRSVRAPGGFAVQSGILLPIDSLLADTGAASHLASRA